MASYRGHLAFSTSLGLAYGIGTHFWLQLDLFHAVIAGGLTAASGLLPDLDSDSGVPVRALFGMTAVLVPLLALPRLLNLQLPLPELLLILAVGYLAIRYGAAG